MRADLKEWMLKTSEELQGLGNKANIDFFYPVGSYYETSDPNFDPNVSWGGTWELEGGGRVHISSGPNEANTTNYWGTCNEGEMNFPLGERGGEHSHTLTVNEIPSHSHQTGIQGDRAGNYNAGGSSAYVYFAQNSGVYTWATGGGQAHHNLQPYTVVNRWHRTA